MYLWLAAKRLHIHRVFLEQADQVLQAAWAGLHPSHIALDHGAVASLNGIDCH